MLVIWPKRKSESGTTLKRGKNGFFANIKRKFRGQEEKEEILHAVMWPYFAIFVRHFLPTIQCIIILTLKKNCQILSWAKGYKNFQMIMHDRENPVFSW